MVNEVLCKIICHNICCLIQESYELGISIEGLGRASVASDIRPSGSPSK
jgi:hypothetical protein